MRWTKGFDVRDGVGHDPVACLQDALKAAGWRGEVTALVNDTVAVLGAARYLDPDTCVSLIAGTGALLFPFLAASLPITLSFVGFFNDKVFARATGTQSMQHQSFARALQAHVCHNYRFEHQPRRALCGNALRHAGSNASYVEHARAVAAMHPSPAAAAAASSTGTTARVASSAKSPGKSPGKSGASLKGSGSFRRGSKNGSAQAEVLDAKDSEEASAITDSVPPPSAISTAGFALSDEALMQSTSRSMELHDPLTVVNTEWGAFCGARSARRLCMCVIVCGYLLLDTAANTACDMPR